MIGPLSIAAPATAALAGFAVAETAMFLLWLLSLALRDASIVDRFWGLGFVLLAWFYLMTSPGDHIGFTRMAVPFAVSIWGIRLSLHIHRRNHGQAEDYRYAAMRAYHGSRFPVVSLFTVFLLQGAILWVVAMPLFAAARGRLGPGILTAGWSGPGPPGSPELDGGNVIASVLFAAGLAVWITGFAFEAIGDAQLARHRADPARRETVLDSGLWAYTRHPNYFGDCLVWWGFWLMAVRTGGAWTIFSPAIMTLLLVRVSGVALLEKKLRERRPDYAAYVRRTPAFFPRLRRPRSD